MEALSYREGDWFAVPLPSGGFGIGLAARVPAGGRILLGYFFGKRFASLPNSEDIPPFDAGAAVLVLMFGDLHLMSGAWPVIRHSEGWTRDRWPLPAFGFKQDVGGKFWRVQYGEDDLSVATMRRMSVSSEEIEGLPKDGLLGAGAVEDMLDRRADPPPTHDPRPPNGRTLTERSLAPTIRYFFYVADDDAAHRLSTELEGLGFRMERRAAAMEDQWLVLAEEQADLDADELDRRESSMAEIAMRYECEYDGYER
jgi:hypothetical protein